MKNIPFVISVVTPSFNQGEFLHDAITSVLSQQGDFFIDYIIIDGGSSDASREIIQSFQNLVAVNCHQVRQGTLTYNIATDHRFGLNRCLGISYRWVSEPDDGQVDALKKGFRLAVGDVLCWLNSDDFFIGHDVFGTVCRYFTADQDLKLLTGDGWFVTKNGKKLGVHHVDRIHLGELLFLDYHILQPSTFFRKSIYKEDFLRDKYICAFDADFFIRLLHNGVKYLKTNDLFSSFRFYPEIKTNALGPTRYRESLKIAWHYSGHFPYLIVSALYRFMDIVLKPRLQHRLPGFRLIFGALYKTSYFIVTGKPGR